MTCHITVFLEMVRGGINPYKRRDEMANNYSQSSSFMEIPKDKMPRVQEIIERAKIEAAKSVCLEYGESEDEYESYLEYGVEIEIKGDGVLFIGDESFCPITVDAIARQLIEELEIDDPFFCSWAYTCSKMRTDEFGGGAMAIIRGVPTIRCDAMSYVQEKANAVSKETKGEQ